MTSAARGRANLSQAFRGGRLVLFVLLVAVAGGLTGWLFFAPGTLQHVLFFDAPVVDLSAKPYVEGEKIEVPAVLVNDSAQTVVVKALPHSCGCMAVDRQGRVELPLVLEPHSRTPLRVEINTAGQGGLKTYRLSAVAETAAGSELPDADLVIVARVYAALYAHPNYFYVAVPEASASEPIRREVLLLDRWEDEGLTIARITSTAGERFRYSLQPDQGDFPVGAVVLKKRHTLAFSLLPKPGARHLDEVITVEPSDKRAKPVTITVTGKVVRPFALEPEALTFYGTKPGQRVERTVQYTYADAADKDVRVLEAPPGFSVRVGPEVEGSRPVVVSCSTPAAGKYSQEIVFQAGSSATTIRLPVEVISAPVEP
jgi:hypothetical protein